VELRKRLDEAYEERERLPDKTQIPQDVIL
jgi:hypothetical protein